MNKLTRILPIAALGAIASFIAALVVYKATDGHPLAWAFFSVLSWHLGALTSTAMFEELGAKV
ncbi:hypothetical protein D3C75_863190 [compost metagenome]